MNRNTTTPLVEPHAVEKLREQELEEARAIQSVMLPAQPLCVGRVTISHEFQPAAEVGGDFLDYFELSDGNIGLYLGDVSGKGLPAALYAALAVGTLRGVHKTAQSPCAVLSLLNKRLLLRGIPARHTALQYAVFDPLSREMQIVSAGMPGPLHLGSKGCRILQLSGLPPGLFPMAEYDAFTLRLEPRDSVLFCTDGLTDARDAEGTDFGLEGLQKICEKKLPSSPVELLGRVFAAVESFSSDGQQQDDRTAAVFHLGP